MEERGWYYFIDDKEFPFKSGIYSLSRDSSFQTYCFFSNSRWRNAAADSKVKVKLSLCLTDHHAMKAYWGVEV
jgi:hypothetical protein